MISQIRKRDGKVARFEKEKIVNAIFKAVQSVGGRDRKTAEKLAENVVRELELKFGPGSLPGVEQVQDVVEKVLIEEGHAMTAKAYILYRAKRAELRAAANESRKLGDSERTALLDMFAHKSKLASIIGYDRIESYKNLLFHIKDKQADGSLPVHPSDYLNGNELATSIYQKKYLLKELANRHIEKRPEDVFARLAAFMAAVEEPSRQVEWAEKFYLALYEGHFLPGGRVIAGGGDLYRLKTMANCFVSLIADDSINSIYDAAYECARTYSYGGGIGVDISVLRPKDSVVHNAADSSTGSVSFMELFSLTTGLIGQSGRRGALMLTIDIKNPDSPLFVNAKKIPNWVTSQIVQQCKWSGKFSEAQLREVERQVRENTQVRFANISLKISDEFMQAVEEQNMFGGKLLVYLKGKDVSSIGIAQGGTAHYSFGIPSKPIGKYRLFRAFGSVEELNSFLAEEGAGMLSAGDLCDNSRRDMFGDIVIPRPGSEHDLAVRYAGDFLLYFNSRETGEIKRMVKARKLWNMFIDGNYRTAEPGLIFWSTMTKYSPSNYVGRPIASTNPCVAADSLVSTERGLERIDSIKAEKIMVDSRAGLRLLQLGTRLVQPSQVVMSGVKDCFKLETRSGYEVVATADHKILTTEGWKEMQAIAEDDNILIQSGEGLFNKDAKLPFAVQNSIIGKNGRKYELNLPTEWSRDLGMLLGWFVGDGFYNESYHKAGLVFAREDEDARRLIQPIFENYCNRQIKEVKYDNGCVQIRSSSKYLIDFLKKLGVKGAGEEREVPVTLFTATEEAVVGFLEGLFSSDGTIGLGSKSRNYVRLNSSSVKLLKQVQLILLNMGIRSSIYDRSTAAKTFRYINKEGELVKYKTSGVNFELNISKKNVKKFIAKIVFAQQKNRDKTEALRGFEFYSESFTDKVKSKEFVGKREVWDITEPETHSFIANGMVVHNCGEVPLEDGGACNLASINLSRFVKRGYTDGAEIDWAGIREATHTVIRFLDNVVTWNEILNPLEKQRRAAFETRRLGLGVMGIADMLNQVGVGYDSDEGLKILEVAAKLIANTAYEASANLAEEKSPSPIFDYASYSRGAFFQECLSEETRELVRRKGLRNIALLSIAPTGTISSIVLGYRIGSRNFIGVSGGIEPIFALYYTRRSESFGNQLFRVFHSTVDAYIHQHGLVEAVRRTEGPDELSKVLPAHFFRTSHYIEPKKRVLVQGLWQRYIDHSISSTVNLPEDVEPETISNIYLDAWKHGLKGITVYREGSRYPILSVESEASDFQRVKEQSFDVEGEQRVMHGDDLLAYPDGRLTTVYHALKAGELRKDNGMFVFAANVPEEQGVVIATEKAGLVVEGVKLSVCPECGMKTMKVEAGCQSCLNDECGFSKCDM
ncbi:hypothetical protein HYY74_07930 [Candidatus Woesearchaeota archaeon]|nr:hypothetical protein [Candidatus Woesearchaeota archaeon]